MSDQHELENGDTNTGVDTALSTNDVEPGIPAPEIDDVHPDEDIAKAALAEGDDVSHPPQESECQPSEETGIEGSTQPTSSEGGEGDQMAPQSIEQSLRYANPYGTFITGIDINSEVRIIINKCVHVLMARN